MPHKEPAPSKRCYRDAPVEELLNVARQSAHTMIDQATMLSAHARQFQQIVRELLAAAGAANRAGSSLLRSCNEADKVLSAVDYDYLHPQGGIAHR